MDDPANVAHHRKTLYPPPLPGRSTVTLPDDKARKIREWLEWLLEKIQPLGPLVPPIFGTVAELQGLIALLPAPQQPNDP